MVARRTKRRRPRSRRAVPLVHAVLGQRLRAIRRVRRLSLDRLGTRAGLSGKFLGEVERGEKSISVDSLYRLAVVLGVSLRYLTDVREATGAEAEALCAILVALPRADRRRAYQVVRTMLGKRSA